MEQLRLRVYGELNDFLPAGQRGRLFRHPYQGPRSVKDLLEVLGLPHPEIGLILVDGQPVGFDHPVRPGERISVFPPFRKLPPPQGPSLRRPLQGRATFLLDVHLGQLAHYLRMLGFDAAYAVDAEDRALAKRADEERRVLLTRDRGLLKRSRVQHGHYVRSTEPRQQLLDVMRRYDLLDAIDPFSRCMECNGVLASAGAEQVQDRVPQDALQAHDKFRLCTRCGNVYWAGSHVAAMERLIAGLKARLQD